MAGLTRTGKGTEVEGKDRNVKIAKILEEHGLDSPQDVRKFLSEEATVKGRLEA